MEKVKNECKKSPDGEHKLRESRLEESIDRDRKKSFGDNRCKYCHEIITSQTKIAVPIFTGENCL